MSFGTFLEKNIIISRKVIIEIYKGNKHKWMSRAVQYLICL